MTSCLLQNLGAYFQLPGGGANARFAPLRTPMLM